MHRLIPFTPFTCAFATTILFRTAVALCCGGSGSLISRGDDGYFVAWQRDLWVSYWRLAGLCEKSKRAAEAKDWWQVAFDTLAGMKARGLHVSPEDLGFLERLSVKAGK